ncbi:MAG: type IV pilus modification protein PilV [Pseudomonadota bacterium]
MNVVSRRLQTGISLIEVLVATNILAFGLLGVAGLQTSTAAHMYIAYQHGQAALLAQSMLEKLRTNRTATLAGLYQHEKGKAPAAPSKNCSEVSCTPAELAAWDLAIWYSMIADTSAKPYAKIPPGPLAMLPSGQTSITCKDTNCSANSIRLITIYWDSHRNGATGSNCDPESASDLTCFRLAYVP